ncbi:rCG36578 [Rattus norvegicus]|uniref:RCG36578 n=1 Tax=Rattus norvegicus TaxID=10116 RepID=A6JSF0_RAT|nr:rCG36578 [Rattus norvegicus]
MAQWLRVLVVWIWVQFPVLPWRLTTGSRRSGTLFSSQALDMKVMHRYLCR